MKFTPLHFLVCLWAIGGIEGSMEAATQFFVAPHGNDAWTGKEPAPNASKTDGPFATLERARDAIRQVKRSGPLPQGGITVNIGEGQYHLDRPFELGPEDSGTADSPIVFRAVSSGTARLMGGKAITNFKPVTDPLLLERIDAKARGQVLQADLGALGLTQFGTAAGDGLELFFQDKPMLLSRWPNEGFVRIVNVQGKTPVDVRGTKGCVEGLFTYAGDRPQRWTEERDIWMHGYWFWDWADQRQKVKGIDTEKRIIELAPPPHGYGYRKGQWFYAYNLLAEIDQPGEWYLDRESSQLFFWPPAPLDQGQVVVSLLPRLMVLKNVSFVTLSKLTMEAVRETAITITGGTSNRMVGCTIRNVGSSALSIDGGAGHGVAGCDIYQCGSGGISLSGGDRTTLAPAGHYADNNHIHHYGRWKPMYSAGIGLYGVGCRATHNLIENAPHQAISFGGNDHLMEFNEIHSVCYESNDAGAIYAGRDWTMRGTLIRHNYMHDIQGFEGRGCVGVYLDDMYCGTEISGNVFCRVTRAAFIGGGRDCLVENNIFADCQPALHVDARAMGWAKYHADEWVKEGQDKGTLSGIRYRQSPYRERYPQLLTILEEEPHAPRGNIVRRNICFGGRWDEIESKARPLLTLGDNLVQEDPRFINAAEGNFQLQDDSPAYRLGFKRIPIEKMGLYPDENRATWPVNHQVYKVMKGSVINP